MTRVRAFFLEEAEECLAAIRRGLEGPTAEPGTVYAAVRKLRGNAQVARFGRLAEEARSLEERLKPVARGKGSWNETLGARVARGVESLGRAVDAVREGRMEQDEREAPMDEQTSNEPGGPDDAAPIETLEYRGREALEQAETLREPLEDAILTADPAGPILDELFDLIRLGTK